MKDIIMIVMRYIMRHKSLPFRKEQSLIVEKLKFTVQHKDRFYFIQNKLNYNFKRSLNHDIKCYVYFILFIYTFIILPHCSSNQCLSHEWRRHSLCRNGLTKKTFEWKQKPSISFNYVVIRILETKTRNVFPCWLLRTNP